MDRNDFIETREDIVKNIKTLYSYLDGKVDSEHKDWAIQRMSQGRNYVIEVVDSQIYFAPRRFVGYVDNTMEKHEANPGNGTETDNKIMIFYQKVQMSNLIPCYKKPCLNTVLLWGQRNIG